MAISRGATAQSFSVLGADLAVKGDISAASDLHIDGTVEGDITCEALVQGETGAITGAISAKSARLSGRIDGSISCNDIVILKSARITGDVRYDTLTIEQGAQVDGRLSPNTSASAVFDKTPAEQALILQAAAE